MLQKELPKSGIKVWTSPAHQVFKAIQAQLPELRIGAIKGGKGLDRFIPGEQNWIEEFPMRHTIALRRFTTRIKDLGSEDWGKLSRGQQTKVAIPSHIMICVFHERSHGEASADSEPAVASAPLRTEKTPDVPIEKSAESTQQSIPVPSWTPMSATISGPKFLALNNEQQTRIKKLHNNLGHPTSEKLARHLFESKADQALVEGARDYLCASCAERRPPGKPVPASENP